MIRVPQQVLRQLSAQFGASAESLKYLGGGREDSDGIAYTYPAPQGLQVLKVLALPPEDGGALSLLEQRIAFSHYMAQCGVPLAAALPDAQGALYHQVLREGHRFVAYSMALCPGRPPAPEELTPAVVRAWGRLTGRAHRAAQSYPTWKRMNGSEQVYGYLDELNSFVRLCRDEQVRAGWEEMRARLSELPITRASYGFIHNDNHQYNILVQGERVTLIDFDVAMCHFFLNDIALPVQGLLFSEAVGGMCAPLRDKEALQRFYSAFLAGYERENHLDSEWLKRLGLFWQYRRLLLFTVMQDYLDANPSLKQGFLEAIHACPGVEI